MPQPAFRRILLAADIAESARSRAGFAVSLANRLGATLEGAAAGVPTVPVYGPFGDGLIDLSPQVRAALVRAIETCLGRAERIFREAGGPADPAAWHGSNIFNAADFVASLTAGFDLVVAGRQGSGDPVDGVLGVDPAGLVTTVGRPVLVVPPGVTQFSNERVAIGWKDSREARRALSDVLALLDGTASVTLIAIADGTPMGLEAARQFLQGHGITSEAIVEAPRGRSDADVFLAAAGQVGATLVAAGAYGHSRLREWVLGGMTQALLDRCPIPCLLSH